MSERVDLALMRDARGRSGRSNGLAALQAGAAGRMHAVTEAIAPPLPRSPAWTLPDGSCDCHAHVFGPDDRFLDDLHLNSLTVARLVTIAAKACGARPPSAPTEFANATPRILHDALRELKELKGGDLWGFPSDMEAVQPGRRVKVFLGRFPDDKRDPPVILQILVAKPPKTVEKE